MKQLKYILSFFLLLILQLSFANSFASVYLNKDKVVSRIEFSETTNSNPEFPKADFKENYIFEPFFYDNVTCPSISCCGAYTELVGSWKVLDDAGETGLSGRIDDIAKVHDYLKSNPTKTAQNVVDDIKTNGWQKWYDDLLKNEFLSKVGKELPENWNKFSLDNNVAFAERLKTFRGNDDLTFDADFRGGEGQLFDSPLSDGLVLKRWFSTRVKDMPESIRLLKEAESLVKTNSELGKLMDVVTVGERGTDWVVRGFKRRTILLKNAVSDPLVAKTRQDAIDILSKQTGEISANILKKLKKNSANVHWSPEDQKLLIIDMQ
jgi:hypothetical protein